MQVHEKIINGVGDNDHNLEIYYKNHHDFN